MHKICPSCNEEIQEENSVCHKCGYNFRDCNSPEVEKENKDIVLVENNHDKEIEYISIDVDGIVEGEHFLQKLSEENMHMIDSLKEKQKERENKERSSLKKKKVIKILWIIFCGVFNAIYFSITGFFECFFVVGIPFGIVLFKMIPLAFNPIGKRVKLNFYKRPFFNLVWLFFGGWLIASIYEIYVLFLYITIIGIPYALQMQKVAKYLWCPFGAQVLNENEFSDHLVEKVAYTVQYLRRNKIVVDETNIEFSEKEKAHLEKIYQIDQPVNQLFLKRGKVIKIVFGVIASLLAFNILRNNFVLLFNLLINAITKGAEPTGFLQIVTYIFNFSFVNFVIELFVKLFLPIETTVDQYLSNIPYFNIIKIYIPIVISLGLLVLLSFLIVKANNKKQEHIIEIDYGYATKKQLVNYYDNGNKMIEEVEDAIIKIYAEYKADVDKEIEMQKEV